MVGAASSGANRHGRLGLAALIASIFAGVAGAMFTAAGNAFTAAANGEMDAADAVADMKAELDGLQ